MGIEELRRLSAIEKGNSYRAAKREQQAIVRKLASAASMLEYGESASYWPEMLVQGHRMWLEDETTSPHIESVLHRLGVDATCKIVSLEFDTPATGRPNTNTRPVILITTEDPTLMNQFPSDSAGKAS